MDKRKRMCFIVKWVIIETRMMLIIIYFLNSIIWRERNVVILSKCGNIVAFLKKVSLFIQVSQ